MILLRTSAGPGAVGRKEDGGAGFREWTLRDLGSDWRGRMKESQGANDSSKPQGEIGGTVLGEWSGLYSNLSHRRRGPRSRPLPANPTDI